MKSVLRENAMLSPNARTLWELEEKCAAFSPEAATNLYTSILRRAQGCLSEGELRRNKITSLEALKSYREDARARFSSCIGGIPAPCGEAAQTLSVSDEKDFLLEKVLLHPRHSAVASANVYVPKDGKSIHPAVLVTIGHDDRGKADPEYQYLAQALAHAGFVALLLDPLGQGERFEHYEQDIDLQPIQGCSGEHDLLDWKCKLMGQSLARYFIQDGLCALDYLAARPDVDASRIGLTGHSGGGTQVCLLLMAAGERFAAAAPCAYVTDNPAMLEHGIDPDNEMLWPRSIAQGLDYIDCLLGIAPKPVLLLTLKHDFFPREGTLRTVEAAKRLWTAVGSSVLPEMATCESMHAYPNSHSRTVAEFFCKHMINCEVDWTGFSFRLFDTKALACTPNASLKKACPDMHTLQETLRYELQACKAERSGNSEAENRAWLLEAIQASRVLSQPEPLVFKEGICGHYGYRCLGWRAEEGIWNTGVLLRHIQTGDKPLPTVIALWNEGVARLCEHSAWVHALVYKGYQVLVIDVVASGTLLPASLGHGSLRIGWGTMYKLNAYLLQLGDSLCGMRIRNAIAAYNMLNSWSESGTATKCYACMG